MLILNKEKEHLLIEKYNFVKEIRKFDDSYYYKTGKSFFIEGFGCKKNERDGRIFISSFSFENQDIIYDLIKDEILLKTENYIKISEKKKLENRITELENKIKELEKNNK